MTGQFYLTKVTLHMIIAVIIKWRQQFCSLALQVLIASSVSLLHSTEVCKLAERVYRGLQVG